jgi:hypothetical protein
MGIIVVLGMVALMASDSMSEFVARGNGNPVYKFVYVEECETGQRDSGFAFAPTGSVVLKQVNRDGTVGDVCKR